MRFGSRDELTVSVFVFLFGVLHLLVMNLLLGMHVMACRRRRFGANNSDIWTNIDTFVVCVCVCVFPFGEFIRVDYRDAETKYASCFFFL